MRRTAAALARGLVAGWALSLARASLGVELAQLPAVDAGTAARTRAAGLLALALGLARRSDSSTPLLWGATAGFALHGLIGWPAWTPTTAAGLFFALLVAAAALAALAPRAVRAEPVRAARPRTLELCGLTLGATGAALALEGVARPLRLLGGGSRADDALFAVLFLALASIAALAFAPLISRRAAAVAGALMLAATALATLDTLHFLAGLCGREGLDRFLRNPRWRLDLSYQGMLQGDLVIGLRALLMPAFAAGTALGLSRGTRRTSALLLGAALAALLGPRFVAATASAVSEPAQAAALRVAVGAALGAAGALVAILGAGEAPRGARAGGVLVALGAGVAAWLAPRPAALPISPWERFEPVPRLVVDAPEGLLTIDPTRDFGLVATLDRRRLSPSPALEPLDERALRVAFGRLAQDGRSAPAEGWRVLLIGQLTPARARALRQLGAGTVDRSGAWHAHMDAIEEVLFDGQARPAGRILAPSELSAAGPWDLAIAAAVEGDAPPRGGAPEASIGPCSAWISARGNAAGGDWGERVRLVSSGLEQFWLELRAPDAAAGSAQAREVFEAGRGRALRPLRWLALRPFERERASMAAALGRLRGANVGRPAEQVAAGLAGLARAQVRSSPFETQAQQTEVDATALRALRDAALAGDPGALLRDFWTDMAQLLADKREIELTTELLAPLAERHGPWVELEAALARADLEMLDPHSAAQRLTALIESRPLDISLRILCADALTMDQRPGDALVQLREADRMQPGRRDIRRRLAMAMARAADPGADALLRELLAEDPDDEALRAYLGGGPYPPVEVRYEPFDPHGH